MARARRSDDKSVPQAAMFVWLLAVLCGAAALYFLFVHVTPHTQPAALGQPRCGSAAFPGPDYIPDSDCDGVNSNRYVAAGLGVGVALLIATGLEETARHRRRAAVAADTAQQ